MSNKNPAMLIPDMNTRKLKAERIGFFACFSLVHAGKGDGRRGLPRQTSDHGWTSPYLEREIHAHEERCAVAWAQNEREEAASFSRVQELQESIPRELDLLDKQRAELRQMQAQDLNFRKHGEEELSAAQIQVRRERELQERLRPREAAVEQSMARLRENVDELTALYSSLKENQNAVRQRCQKLDTFLRRRAAIYWSGAVRTHKGELPPAPELHIPYYAETLYTGNHRELMDEANQLLQALHTGFSDDRREAM